MTMKKRILSRLSATAAILTAAACVFCACGNSAEKAEDTTEKEESASAGLSSPSTGEISTTLDKIDNSKWQYNADDNVYYQIGISYCASPADAEIENLAVFVPGDYFSAEDNGDGTYTCTINESAEVGGYTVSSAPVVMPVNTPGYSAQDALTDYSSDVTSYTDAGFIYVHAGCRGRDDGAPAGVTDLKAAIRYIRYNSGNIPGDTERIFSFGMSGGGAQSALLGVTGDSAMYDDYLTAIGAVTGVGDAVYGSQAWCPITSLDSADEAYEWNMGNTRTGLSDEEQTISDDLTAAFATYMNNISLKDDDGNVLTLEESDDGRYQAGSYYDYIKGLIEESLNNFLSDTAFPYDASSSSNGGGMAGGGAPGGATDGEASFGKGPKDGGEAPSGAPDGNKPGDASADQTDSTGTDSTDTNSMANAEANDNISRGGSSSSSISLSGTYETAQDYIDALNANGTWVTYDAETNTATITSIADFAAAVKTASKSLGAFDQLDEGQGENTLFGYADGNGAHFDSIMAELLKTEGSEYADAYSEDLTTEDAEGNTVDFRLNMYSPLYYLMESSEGYQSSNVAKYFRVNTGIFQSDTAVTTEANLVQALKNYGADVDYSFVWGLGHTTAERTGDSTTNFISWVNECCAS